MSVSCDTAHVTDKRLLLEGCWCSELQQLVKLPTSLQDRCIGMKLQTNKIMQGTPCACRHAQSVRSCTPLAVTMQTAAVWQTLSLEYSNTAEMLTVRKAARAWHFEDDCIPCWNRDRKVWDVGALMRNPKNCNSWASILSRSPGRKQLSAMLVKSCTEGCRSSSCLDATSMHATLIS